MEAYILDRSYRTTRVIDAFNSLIWNDVYLGAGDFELQFVMDELGLAYIEEGYHVSIPESTKYMTIEKIEIKTSFKDGNHVILSGRSLESILDSHIVRKDLTLKGNILSAATLLLNQNIILPTNINRQIAGFSIKPTTDENVLKSSVDMFVEAGTNLYDAIKELCQGSYCGFRINLRQEKFYEFELYSGKDRSYEQMANPWVVFSPKIENLEDSDLVINMEDFKNTAEIDVDITLKITVTDSKGGTHTDTEKYTRTLTVNDQNKGADRKEIYCKYSIDAGTIDKTSLGTAEARVNRYPYMEWQLLYIDRNAYNNAMEKFNERTASAIASASGDHTVYKDIALKPGDPGYKDVSQTPGAEWVNTRTVVDEEATAKAKASANAYIQNVLSGAPDISDYEVWGWDFKPGGRQEYDAAVNAAQADIDTEFQALKDQALNWATQVATQKALTELKQYQTVTYFEGSIDPFVSNKYGRDFFLGDIVQITNEYHFSAKTRVAGVMFSQDDVEGEKITPIFESDDTARVAFDFEDLPETTALTADMNRSIERRGMKVDLQSIRNESKERNFRDGANPPREIGS